MTYSDDNSDNNNNKIESNQEFKSIIVQSDRTIMVETNSSNYDNLREMLGNFAELIKTPDYFHTYQITNISIWNAASRGITSQDILSFLHKYSKYPIPVNIQVMIQETIKKYGSIILEKDNVSGELVLLIKNQEISNLVENSKELQSYIRQKVDAERFIVSSNQRGNIKKSLIKLGYPVKDIAGYSEGNQLNIEIVNETKSNDYFELRQYQIEAVKSFYNDGSVYGGSGVILLPCGAGKTIIAIGVMELLSQHTLIICSSTVAVKQWITEIIDKTNLTEADIGEYTSAKKEIKPITVTTYQILTYRNSNSNDLEKDFTHLEIFNSNHWGLIIYDEVHLLPAPVFRMTANLQAIRRLGLTATLIREDGYEEDVFSLIGPIKYNIPWMVLQEQGWIATAKCHEIRIPLIGDYKDKYLQVPIRQKYRIAAENPLKLKILDEIIENHEADSIIIIAQYIHQLKSLSNRLKDVDMITGQTSTKKRIELYKKFQEGEISKLIVSKVANYAIDLPNANVMIQLSGSYGSRQEEAQRLGRILRPKLDKRIAHFYTIVSGDTIDEQFATNRQLFLVEQGYSYDISIRQ
jgi:DNA excision repair protein ERCC-3